MPLLLDEEEATPISWGRPVELAGLPVFNRDDRDWIVTDLDGWESVGVPDAVLVPRGGGPGAVSSGPWLPKEAYYTLSGVVALPIAQQGIIRRALLAAVMEESPMIVYGWDGLDLQAFVRLYDKPEFVRTPAFMEFVLPLVAVDPYKYAIEPLSGAMGVHTGEDWYETFTLDSGSWVETFTSTGGWHETYQQEIPSSEFPVSRTLESPGDVSSQRVIGLVVGPLSAGDWWLLSETTGARLGVALDVAAGQSVIFDCGNRLATLGGVDVTSFVFGTWLTLEPGLNEYRLVSGTQSDAYGGITAYPAYL